MTPLIGPSPFMLHIKSLIGNFSSSWLLGKSSSMWIIRWIEFATSLTTVAVFLIPFTILSKLNTEYNYSYKHYLCVIIILLKEFIQ